ncbi:hypothetical protein B9Z55_009047 [Caenorhabditis nigoni]|uniref:Uncharacterized protein n=1 Tax=Caenorhabditis nigoni TaxID=1611254 RepID=A0A2G5UQF3_9PELO|nr:hypothetical protein B9Z55_009047 [Caenorhabditis nigoni]
MICAIFVLWNAYRYIGANTFGLLNRFTIVPGEFVTNMSLLRETIAESVERDFAQWEIEKARQKTAAFPSRLLPCSLRPRNDPTNAPPHFINIPSSRATI